MTPMTTRPAGTHARAPGNWPHPWTTRPAGTHARGKRRPAGEVRPLSGPWSGAVGTLGTEHAVVVMAEGVVVSGDRGAGEENDRHHENDASDDHYPRRYLVEPGMLYRIGGRRYIWRRRRRRLDRRFGCLGHVLIMPRHGPTINQPRARVCRASFTVLAVEQPGEFQNHHSNERYPGDDRHPGRYLVQPLGMI